MRGRVSGVDRREGRGARLTPRAALAALAALGWGCSERPHLPSGEVRKDAGAAVVLVDRTPPRMPGRPGLPTVRYIDEREPNDDLPHAQPFELPQGIRGTIGAPKPPERGKGAPRGDVDVYQWLAAGEGRMSAVASLSGVPGFTLELEALDGDGKRIAIAESTEGQPALIPDLPAQVGETRFLKVRPLFKKGVAPRGDPDHPYQLILVPAPQPAGEEIEPNDDLAHATPMAAGAAAQGYFGRRRDEDWLSLATEGAPAGATLRLELSAVDGVAPGIKLADGAGKVMVAARAGKGEELRLRNAPAVLPKTLIALAAEAGFSTDVRWTLAAAIEPPLAGAEVEPNDDPAHATALDPAVGRVSGFLWPGDADCYSVRFAAPTVAKVELEAPEGVDVKLEWIAQSPDGTVEVLARADDGGPGKPELLPNPAGDKLLLRVTARARDTAFDAPYQVTVTAIGDDGAGEREPNGVPGRATAIEVGRPLRAFLAPRGDEDWYKLAAPAAGQLRATAQGGPRGLTVTLYDESRAPVGGSSGASAKGPVEAGRSYYVVVRDPAGKASDPRNAYTLSLSVE